MAVSLTKGQKVDLTKGNPGLSKLLIGLGWDTNKYDGGSAFDLDAAAFLLTGSGKVDSDGDFVFYGNLKHASGSVEHMGDNLTGEGEGDDEQIRVDLTNMAPAVAAIVFTVNSFRGQTFDEVENAYCRLLNGVDDTEIARFTLSGGGAHTAMIMAKVYRHNGEWKMHAIGEPTSGRTVEELVPGIRAIL